MTDWANSTDEMFCMLAYSSILLNGRNGFAKTCLFTWDVHIFRIEWINLGMVYGIRSICFEAREPKQYGITLLNNWRHLWHVDDDDDADDDDYDGI